MGNEATITVRDAQTPPLRTCRWRHRQRQSHYLSHHGPKGPERISYQTTVSEDYAG